MASKAIDRGLSPALCIVLVVFVALALCYSYATRLKWAPDEPAHFIYIRSLATNFAPPPIAHHITGSEDSESTHEGHQPPLYYAIMAVPFALLKAMGASNEVIWRVLRLATVPIGVAWICMIYVLAREFFGKESYALAVMAFAALIPTSAYMAGVINNEVLIALLFTWSLIPILRYFKSAEISTSGAVFLGVLIGLAALAKAQGLVLVPTFLLVAFLVCRRQRYGNYKAVLVRAATVLVVFAAVCGWWFARSLAVNGALMPHSLYNPMLESGLAGLLMDPQWALEGMRHLTMLLYAYFLAPFWLVREQVSIQHYIRFLYVLTAVVLVGLMVRLRRNGEIDRRSLALLLFPAAVQYFAYVRYVLVVDSMAVMQGRLFLTVAGVVSIVFVLGFDGFLKSTRAKKVGAVVGFAVMALVNIGVIAGAVRLYR